MTLESLVLKSSFDPRFIDDNFKDWWKWRNTCALSRWMCCRCLIQRRKGIDNPHYDDSPEFIKRVERLERKRAKNGPKASNSSS